jgi:hypothetical protein
MRHVFHVLTIATFLGMAAILTVLGMALHNPPTPDVATASRAATPTYTPDGRIDYLVSMAETRMPTPTETERPERTRIPTLTPIPQCQEPGAKGLCLQWTATPSKTPQPTYTPSPTLGPCGTPDHWGVFPAYCFGD